MKATQSQDGRSSGVRVTLDAVTAAEIDRLAEREGLSRAGLVRRVLEDWMQDEAEGEALAREAKRRLEDPDEPRIPWEQVKVAAIGPRGSVYT